MGRVKNRLRRSIVLLQLHDSRAWEVLLEVGAGTGSVYLLRWYWWRVNAWSEIAAMSTALIVSLTIDFAAPFHGSEPAVFAKQTLVTTALTTAVWVAVTLLTPAEPRDILERFYRRVRPDVRGWKPIARLAPDVVPIMTSGAISCTRLWAAA